MKDARGHGSNKRGNLSVPDQHQHRILKDTVRNPLKGMFLGGPNAQDAEATLRSKFGYSDAEIGKLKGSDNAVAARGLASGPKSAPAPVHDSMARTAGQSDRSYIAQRLTGNAEKSAGVERAPGESDASYIKRRIS